MCRNNLMQKEQDRKKYKVPQGYRKEATAFQTWKGERYGGGMGEKDCTGPKAKKEGSDAREVITARSGWGPAKVFFGCSFLSKPGPEFGRPGRGKKNCLGFWRRQNKRTGGWWGGERYGTVGPEGGPLRRGRRGEDQSEGEGVQPGEKQSGRPRKLRTKRVEEVAEKGFNKE